MMDMRQRHRLQPGEAFFHQQQLSSANHLQNYVYRQPICENGNSNDTVSDTVEAAVSFNKEAGRKKKRGERCSKLFVIC